MAERIDHKAEADQWLRNAKTFFGNSGDGTPEERALDLRAAAVAALIGIGHALRDLTGSIEAGGRP